MWQRIYLWSSKSPSPPRNGLECKINQNLSSGDPSQWAHTMMLKLDICFVLLWPKFKKLPSCPVTSQFENLHLQIFDKPSGNTRVPYTLILKPLKSLTSSETYILKAMLASPNVINSCLPEIHQINWLKSHSEKIPFKNCNYVCHLLFLRRLVFNLNIITSPHLSSTLRNTSQVCCSC